MPSRMLLAGAFWCLSFAAQGDVVPGKRCVPVSPSSYPCTIPQPHNPPYESCTDESDPCGTYHIFGDPADCDPSWRFVENPSLGRCDTCAGLNCTQSSTVPCVLAQFCEVVMVGEVKFCVWDAAGTSDTTEGCGYIHNPQQPDCEGGSGGS